MGLSAVTCATKRQLPEKTLQVLCTREYHEQIMQLQAENARLKKQLAQQDHLTSRRAHSPADTPRFEQPPSPQSPRPYTPRPTVVPLSPQDGPPKRPHAVVCSPDKAPAAQVEIVGEICFI